jgi:hypothetical protein
VQNSVHNARQNPGQNGQSPLQNPGKVKPLAQGGVAVYESPSPASLYCYSPGIEVLPSGRLVVTMDLGGPGVKELEGPKTSNVAPKYGQGKVFTSDDGGVVWTHRHDFPFKWARPFLVGGSLYILGVDRDILIIRSDDEGESWTSPYSLTEGQSWHQAPGNVWYANEFVYLVMEKRTSHQIEGWYVGELAPILMKASIHSDLTNPTSWIFASELSFADALDVQQLDHFGVPFYPALKDRSTATASSSGRDCAPLGWLESHVIQIVDPHHYWHDPSGRTFHLWMRAHTGGTGYAAMVKVVEQPDGTMETLLEHVPSGKSIVYVPCPGGQMKFHIIYDTPSGMYWLLSSQATDSMTRAEKLPSNRYGLPNNERHRLQLHFSRNMIDWCFAGLVDAGETPEHSRHYASMAVDGQDLLIASRSGNERAKDAHNGNLITFHRIQQFRDLVY